MATIIQIRRDTAANWTTVNPILAEGEIGLETDTNKIKFGDGTTAWNSLSYFIASNVASVNGKTGIIVLTAADIGAATSAQGAKADTAVQPGDLGSAALAETSDFATATQGTLAGTALQPNDNLSELNNDTGFITLSALNGYQHEATIQTLSATDSITLADNTIYNGGEQTALTIALPSTDTIGFICDVDFTSGATATTLSYSLPDIFWEGVDVAYDSTAQKNIFTPVANKRYTIVFYFDGVNYNGRVGGV